MHAVKLPRPRTRHIAGVWLYYCYAQSIIKVVPQHKTMGTIKISDVVHEDLAQYKQQHEHTSFDSAVRELLRRVDDE